jgi:hypothetical protein
VAAMSRDTCKAVEGWAQRLLALDATNAPGCRGAKARVVYISAYICITAEQLRGRKSGAAIYHNEPTGSS